jgi:hypothetical protein
MIGLFFRGKMMRTIFREKYEDFLQGTLSIIPASFGCVSKKFIPVQLEAGANLSLKHQAPNPSLLFQPAKYKRCYNNTIIHLIA